MQHRGGRDKGGLMRDKKIEWKDTRFSFSVDYNYSLFVRNRYVFFWGTGSRWRKIINFASKFVRQNNICVVYIYGEPRGKFETFRNYIAKLKGNIIVICFEASCTDLEAIQEYEEWKKTKKAVGLIDKSGNLIDSYFTDLLFPKDNTQIREKKYQSWLTLFDKKDTEENKKLFNDFCKDNGLNIV